MQVGLITAYILKICCIGRQVTFFFNTLERAKDQDRLNWEYQTSKIAFSNSESKYAFRHSSVREIALMMLMAYLSYMLAEVT